MSATEQKQIIRLTTPTDVIAKNEQEERELAGQVEESIKEINSQIETSRLKARETNNDARSSHSINPRINIKSASVRAIVLGMLENSSWNTYRSGDEIVISFIASLDAARKKRPA